MSVARLEHIPGFNVDRVAAAAGDDPDVLRVPWAEQIDPLDLGHGVANRMRLPTGGGSSSVSCPVARISPSFLGS